MNGRNSSCMPSGTCGSMRPVRRTALASRKAPGVGFDRLNFRLSYASLPVMNPAVCWSSDVTARSKRTGVASQRLVSAALAFVSW